MTEEDKYKPIPSGRPRPGILIPKEKEEEKDKGRQITFSITKGEGRLMTMRLLNDYRFWIFVSGFTIGFILGRF